jgi:hypothetical protein
LQLGRRICLQRRLSFKTAFGSKYFHQKNKHLSEIPSASEIEKNEDVNPGEIQLKFLQKIEELTLYVIQQNEEIQTLKNKLNEMENK